MWHRMGYTLIELIGAMAASSVLLLGLASTVAISTSLVEPTDLDSQLQRDRVIFDRINHDMRYATSVDTSDGIGFSIDRLDPNEQSQSLYYESYGDGLIRQVNGGDGVRLDVMTPSVNHYVDGFSAPTTSPAVLRPRIRDHSTAATDGGGGSSISIDLPDGARTGDLLMMVSAWRNTPYLLPRMGNWTRSEVSSTTGIVMVVDWQHMDASVPRTLTLDYLRGGDIAVVMMAIENTNSTRPFGWSGNQTGVSSRGDASTYPQPIENAETIDPETLNLNLFASTESPFHRPSIGVASFCDLVEVVASRGTGGECTLAIASRTGPMPEQSTPPRALHQQSNNWVTLGIEVEGDDE